jgi:N-carbamoyl-L-amino-acid hydrolase
MTLHIDRDRLLADIETLASFSGDAPPGITRLVFSAADQEARTWLKSQCREAGLAVREDAVGNTFARWVGARPELGAIGTGSHIDAVPHSGKFDGTVGVLGGLEAIRALQQSGFQPQRSIELLLFTAEEPTRFGLGCLGSRMLIGNLGGAADAQLKDPEGSTLAELREAAGFHGSLDGVKLPDGYYAGFVELHIEQGPLLEKEGLAIGIVTGIAAPAALRIVVEGRRARRRSHDARPQGRLLRRRGDCSGRRGTSACDWFRRHLRHGGQVPCVSRSGEQYSQPGGDGSRYS